MIIPKIGLGTRKLSPAEATNICLTGLDLGYRHIDTAQRYENEHGVGQAIKQTSIDRKDFFLTTKVRIDEFDYKKCIASVEESLKKLQTDYIDLVLMHRPNPQMDHLGTLDALLELKAQGKIKMIGVSNFTLSLLEQAIEHTKNQIFCNQIEMHPLFDPVKVRKFCQKNKINITAYSPLAHGKIFEENTLKVIADKHNKTIAQVALRRLIDHEGVAVIPKASSIDHLKQNRNILDFQLDDEDKTLIDSLPKNKRLINPDFAPDRND